MRLTSLACPSQAGLFLEIKPLEIVESIVAHMEV